MQTFKKLSFGALVLLGSMGMAIAAPCGGTTGNACTVPEPSSLPLLGLGLVGAIVVARFFKK